MSEHTKGNWTAGCPNGKRHYVMAGGHTVIAELPATQGESSAYVIEQYNVRKANARLISAAPDLLAALVRALPEISSVGIPDLLEQCREAIAKARGQSWVRGCWTCRRKGNIRSSTATRLRRIYA